MMRFIATRGRQVYERVMSVSFDDCLNELVRPGGPAVNAIYQRWLSHPARKEVHTFVQKFRHDYLFDVTQEEVRDVARRTCHALGTVKREENHSEVRDFDTPFAHQYLFHRYLESYRKVPTWQEFKEWMIGEGEPYYLRPFVEKFGLDLANPRRPGTDDRIYWRALRWRLGIFYYSALRELDLFAALRERHKLPLRYHIFADVVLRSDFWCGDTVVCLYISNQFFRAADEGRKLHIDQVFRAGGSDLRLQEAELVAENRFGEVWFVRDAVANNLAERLKVLLSNPLIGWPAGRGSSARRFR